MSDGRLMCDLMSESAADVSCGALLVLMFAKDDPGDYDDDDDDDAARQ